MNGPSHFGQLRYRRPRSKAWIDREADQHDRELIGAIVRLATSFGAQTIAEGIENQETLDLLKSLGVTHAQGFHLGRPAPIPSA